MKIAVVGVTGMVGQVMLKVMQELELPVTELLPVASSQSVGKTVDFNGKSHSIISVKDAIKLKPAIALFSAGGEISKQYARKFTAAGTTVIDNSSAFRMESDIKLIVPEINGHTLITQDKIIANPNCSTIQMVMALAPLHKEYGINRLVISTYQSISGTGIKAVQQLESESKGERATMVYPYSIHRNAIPHCDDFQDNGYTKEELKLINETQKILDDRSIAITATAVRIPVVGGHSESVNIEFNKDFNVSTVRQLLAATTGVTVQDNTDLNTYPMPLTAHHKNDVFVGRIRRDFSRENCLNMWIVSDNLRKGAATNTVQIAKHLIDNNLISNAVL